MKTEFIEPLKYTGNHRRMALSCPSQLRFHILNGNSIGSKLILSAGLPKSTTWNSPVSDNRIISRIQIQIITTHKEKETFPESHVEQSAFNKWAPSNNLGHFICITSLWDRKKDYANLIDEGTEIKWPVDLLSIYTKMITFGQKHEIQSPASHQSMSFY